MHCVETGRPVLKSPFGIDFRYLHYVHTGPESYAACFEFGSGVSLPEGKTISAWNSLFTYNNMHGNL
jgi:hypothetical protein